LLFLRFGKIWLNHQLFPNIFSGLINKAIYHHKEYPKYFSNHTNKIVNHIEILNLQDILFFC
ncbi:MAG: hypothetical protein ACKO96_03540, partial [Flammeovirgaceae bacterium]